MILERKRRRREQRRFRICLALEIKTKRLTDHRTCAIGADDETGTQFRRRLVATQIQRHAGVVLGNAVTSVAKKICAFGSLRKASSASRDNFHCSHCTR